MIKTVIGLIFLVLGEGLSLFTLYTSWFGKGDKDGLASIFLFIPCLLLCLIGLGFVGIKYWTVMIPPILVVLDIFVKR